LQSVELHHKEILVTLATLTRKPETKLNLAIDRIESSNTNRTTIVFLRYYDKVVTIDVIIPFHRVDQYLVNSITSILASYKVGVRLLLVDDRVNPSQIPLALPKNTQVLMSGGVGFARALRIGLNAVTSSLFAFQDSDDWSSPKRLLLQSTMLRKLEADIVICGMQITNESGRRRLFQPPHFTGIEALKFSNLLGSINSNSTWLCRAKVLDDENFMNEKYISIDWATTLTLDSTIRLAYISQRLYFYRQHKLQLTQTNEYKELAFSQIYPLWNQVNISFGLPELTMENAISVAAPWAIKGGVTQFPLDWVHAFLACSKISSSQDYFYFKQLILRRIWQNPGLSSTNKARLALKVM
jgi:glycosyltransferase involved in cell wall biosynthesis